MTAMEQEQGKFSVMGSHVVLRVVLTLLSGFRSNVAAVF